ncbi:MAG: nucleotidyltransferase family protein, partial [Pseudomonadota bacterium]
METLQAARGIGLPDWAIGAGFIRNAVWDHLHGYDKITPLADIDVLYFEPSDLSKERELDIEAILKAILPDRPWSVRNQARMHLRNNDAPYASTEDALRYWLE